jgi:hypothetical protein
VFANQLANIQQLTLINPFTMQRVPITPNEALPSTAIATGSFTFTVPDVATGAYQYELRARSNTGATCIYRSNAFGLVKASWE